MRLPSNWSSVPTPARACSACRKSSRATLAEAMPVNATPSSATLPSSTPSSTGASSGDCAESSRSSPLPTLKLATVLLWATASARRSTVADCPEPGNIAARLSTRLAGTCCVTTTSTASAAALESVMRYR
ncbi:hypothetical protein D9M71_236870 [compost metagenome]